MLGATKVEDVTGTARYREPDSGKVFDSLGDALRAARWLDIGAPGVTTLRLTRKGHQDTIICQRSNGTWYVQWLGRPLHNGKGCGC